MIMREDLDMAVAKHIFNRQTERCTVLPYSINLLDAWAIVDWMRNNEWHVELDLGKFGDWPGVRMTKLTVDKEHRVTRDEYTAEHMRLAAAICMCALKAYGLEVEE